MNSKTIVVVGACPSRKKGGLYNTYHELLFENSRNE